MSVSPAAVAIFKANAYSKNGICVDAANDLKQAARDYNKASLAYESAVNNVIGAGASTIGASLGGFGCLYLGPTPAAAICILGAGFLIIGGTAWTESSFQAAFAAEDELEVQDAAFDRAMTKFCKCLHTHAR